jgi:hypothetical protein
LSHGDLDLIQLLVTLRNANTMVVDAINAYLEAKAPPEIKAERFGVPFPEDLRRLLSFEEIGEWIIIRPRGYLGSENFAKIAAIVKENEGVYVSAGKGSHFKIPKRAKTQC